MYSIKPYLKKSARLNVWIVEKGFFEESYSDLKNVLVKTAHFCLHSLYWMNCLRIFLVLRQFNVFWNFHHWFPKNTSSNCHHLMPVIYVGQSFCFFCWQDIAVKTQDFLWALFNWVIIQRIIVNILVTISMFWKGLNASIILMWLICNIPKHLTKSLARDHNVLISTTTVGIT